MEFTGGEIMPEYKVKWDIELQASSPKEAAELAQEMMRDPIAMVGCFTVRDEDNQEHFIDLDLDQEDEND
jgi:hypothetical protein